MGLFSNAARDEQGNELRRRKTDQIPFSIIASDMTVVGDLETEGVVRIEGRVKEPSGAAPGPGRQRGRDRGGSAYPGGRHRRPGVRRHPRDRPGGAPGSAVVTGDIHTPRIAIVEGAKVTGEVKMDGRPRRIPTNS